ncbi:hypothetical protein P153DRAFT_323742, partial [Dothidotthia symphoricarpi CBS 119687]
MSLWPPPTGVTTPKVPTSKSVLTITASTPIHAPAHVVFALLLDTSTYPIWNPFVPKVTITSHPDNTPTQPNETLQKGTKFTFHAIMGAPGSTPALTNLIVSDISTPEHPSDYVPAAMLTQFHSDLATVYRMAWANDPDTMLARGLQNERFHEVIVRGEEECEVRTWEVMGGVMAWAVRWMYKGVLEAKFGEWCGGLKS